MAFAGMFIGLIFVIIIIVAYVIALIELIVGIILLVKKKKVPGIVLVVLSAIPAVVTVIVFAVGIINFAFPRYETYDGRSIIVKTSDSQKMKELLLDEDMDGLDRLLDNHPELIYYQDNNHVSLLEYGLQNHNVEIMQIAVDHGAKFDAEPTFRLLVNDYSLENFFKYEYWTFVTTEAPVEADIVSGVTTDEIIESAKFAVDHGAETIWTRNTGRWTFADSVENWIDDDNVISEKDKEFLDYARAVSLF